jgi:hypothetical protein
MADEKNEPKQDVLRPPIFVTVIGAIIGLLTMFVIIAVMVWVGRPAPPPPPPDAQPPRTIEEVRAAEQEALNTYGWIDREQGVVQIPVERAMELLIGEARRQDPAVSGDAATGQQPERPDQGPGENG